jgi:hypothetical protein
LIAFAALIASTTTLISSVSVIPILGECPAIPVPRYRCSIPVVPIKPRWRYPLITSSTSRHHALLHLRLFILLPQQFLLLRLDKLCGDAAVTGLSGEQELPQSQHEFCSVFGREEAAEGNLHLSRVGNGFFFGFKELHHEFNNNVILDTSQFRDGLRYPRPHD